LSLEVSVKRFRDTIEAIEDPRLRIKLKTGYLLAARNSELCTRVVPMDLLTNASKPYGLFMRYNLADFNLSPTDPEGMRLGLKEPISEKALVITVAVAKRGKRITQKQRDALKLDDTITTISPQEIEMTLLNYGMRKLFEKYKQGEIKIDPLLIKALQGKVVVKAVALPCKPEYEPWTMDLLKWIREKGKLSVDFTRKTVWSYTREGLAKILPPKSLHNIKNPLRHFRISHLISYYGFQPYDITAYSGWTIRGTFQSMGMSVSGNLDFYAHLAWRQYFPSLLKPIINMK
jgi:hypothetical protein